MTIKELETKIQSLSAKEIIMAMVEGLKNPKTKIDMLTYGSIQDDICYGCAATNSIIQLSDLTPEEACMVYYKSGPNGVIENFEKAINELRMGSINEYNFFAEDGKFAEIEHADVDLPYLYVNYTQEELEQYIQLANLQP